jgi:hypothetical protein
VLRQDKAYLTDMRRLDRGIFQLVSRMTVFSSNNRSIRHLCLTRRHGRRYNHPPASSPAGCRHRVPFAPLGT